MKKNKLLLAAALLFCTAGAWAQTDVTDTYITNADFSAITGWAKVNTNFSSANTNNKVTEWYRNSDGNNSIAAISQQLTDLEEGVYRMTIHGFFRTSKAYTNLAFFAETTDRTLYSPLKTLASGTTAYGSTPNSTSTAYTAFTTSEYWMNTLDNIIIDKVTNASGNLLIGMKPTGQIAGNGSNHWICIGNVKLYKLEGAALDGLRDEIVSNATTLYNENTSATGASALNLAISTLSSIADANLKYSDIKTLQTAIETFRMARMIDATVESPIDATFLIKNPGFEDGAKSLINSEVGMSGTNLAVSAGGNYEAPHGWTTTISGAGNSWDNSNVTSASDLSMATSAQTTPTEGSYFYAGRRRWSSNANTISQVVNDLPNGSYRISVDLGKAAGTAAGTFTATLNGSSKMSVTPANAGLATYTSETFIVDNDNNDLTIQFANATSGDNDRRFIIDNVVLTYYGDPLAAARAEWQTVWDELNALDKTVLPDAAKAAITDALTETEPTTVEGYNTTKEALQTLIDSYEGIKTAYDKVNALVTLTTNEKKNSTGSKTEIEAAISTANTNKEACTTASALEEVYNTLETARQTYVLVAKPTAGHVFDYTFKISDATVTGSGNWSNKGTANGQQYTDAPDNKYMDCGWNSTYQSYQTVSDLPAGYYTLKAATRARESEVSSANIYVNQERSELNRSTDNHRDGSTGGELGNGWSWTEVDFELRATGNVSVGFYAKTTGQGWAGADDFHLYYKGNAVADEVANALKETVVSGKMNATVASTQSSALSTFESAQTIENYEALEVAIAAANASKDAYTAGNEKLTAMKAVIDATNVYTTDALNTYYTTPKGKYDDNSLTDEEAAALQNPSTRTGWHADITVDNFLLSSWNTAPDFDGENSPYYINTWSNEGNSDGSGMTTPFFEYFVNNGNNAKLAGRTLTATMTGIAEGNYYVDVLVRVYKNSGEDETATGITLDINGGSPVDICTGTAGTNNCFYGTFRALGAVDGSGVLNININVAGENNVHWLAFKNVMYSVFNGATSEQKDALASAISNAEGKTLGFSDGEYAPYNNIDVLTALADAKVLDLETTTATEVTNATAAIGDANWTVNDGDVDAIYNGNFAEANGTNPKGWTRSNGAWGQQITKLTTETNGVAEETTTAWYYNTEGAWEYGKDGAYTMPLAENQAYKLTFKYRSHAEGTNNWLKASVLDESLEDVLTGDGVIFAKNADATMFVTATAYFTTGAAGNHVLILHNSGNTHLTDVSLVKVDPATFELSDNTTYEAADRTYYQTLTLKRTIKAEKWNTFCVPFDMTAEEITSQLGTGTEVKKLTGATQNGDHYTLTFADALIEDALTIEAGKPYMVKVPSDVTSITLRNKDIVEDITPTTVGDVTFTGTYTSGNAPMGSFIISNNKFYEVNSEVALKAFRGYITVDSGSGSVKALNFEFEDDATSINEELRVKNEESAGAVYDLSGRRINSQSSILNGQLPKGIYIVNGKKVLK